MVLGLGVLGVVKTRFVFSFEHGFPSFLPTLPLM